MFRISHHFEKLSTAYLHDIQLCYMGEADLYNIG